MTFGNNFGFNNCFWIIIILILICCCCNNNNLAGFGGCNNVAGFGNNVGGCGC